MEKYNTTTLVVFDVEKPYGIDEYSFEAFILGMSNIALRDIRHSLTLTNIDIDKPFGEFDIFDRGPIARAIRRQLEKDSTQEFSLESKTLNSTIVISFDLVDGCLKLKNLGNDKLIQRLHEWRGNEDGRWGVFWMEWWT